MNVRDTFFNRIYEYTKEGEDIIIVSSDLGAPSLDDFRRDFPQRFVNVGIAEQNSIAVAAGLSLAGKKVITYGLNPFPVTRAFDQIRNVMASLRIPVTVCALKVGTSTAEAGFSHIAIENMSLLRTLHNVQIINPSDETVSKKIVKEILEKPAPRFIQFDPAVSGIIYHEDEIDFDKGFAVSGNSDKNVIITYGAWVKTLRALSLDAKIIDCYSLPVNSESLVNEMRNCEKIITVEDGVAEGGIGSMVLEILSDNGLSIPVERLALRFNDGYPKEYTNRQNIYKAEDITIERIKKIIQGI